jgi:hypothetical protein
MRYFVFFMILVLAIGLAGCAQPELPSATVTLPPTMISPTSTPIPTPTKVPIATPTQAPTTTSNIPIDAVMLRNGTYFVPQYHSMVKIVDGKYKGASGATTLSVDMLPNTALGDLNQDGVNDAAVLIAENGGGSGVFVSLVVVYYQDGKLVQGGSAYIDDRPKINSLSIENGKIYLDALIHRAADIMVRPTMTVKEVYEANGDLLELVKFESDTLTGLTRSIQIESPIDGAAVSGSVEVKGSMPIAPFENNLAYHVINQNGKKIAEGAFMVKADQPGGPATFDQTIDLSKLRGAGLVRLELVEVSMADGSILTLNSVHLNIQ